MVRVLILIAAVLALAGVPMVQAAPEDEGLAAVPEEKGLPRVLVIGDSISIGYTPVVREQLQGIANVQRIPANSEHTANVLKNLDAWLKTGDSDKWDVIHINVGLHDIKQNKGKVQVSAEDYEKNLKEILTRLKKTGARVIFGTTTPVPEGAKARTPGDEVKLNEIAVKVCKELGVEVNDLYGVVKDKLGEVQNAKDVHYKKEGYELLGKVVAEKVKRALGK